MSNSYIDHKKRPPPIAIPTWPQPRPTPGPNAFANISQERNNQQQDASNFTSASAQSAVRSVTTPLVSPLEQNMSRSGSHASKARTSAMTTLSNLMDQARMSPRKSDQASSMPSRRGTTHSRQSELSHRSATAAQAQLEALDKDTTVTTRAQIESRTERKLFKMTGQIPPTPTTGAVDVDSVFIRSEDLREQCRVVSGEKRTEREDATKSPKKKLFGVSFPTFSRTPASTPMPEMPLKAAQVLGTTPSRKPRRVEVRPIKPASPKTPKRVPRSDTSKSLPAKVYEQRAYNRHHSSPGKRRATARKTSIGKSPGRSAHASPSNDSVAPPTPPAKDTPPRAVPLVNPPSPLRRAPISHNLRQSYGEFVDKGMQLQLPTFALSPSPQKTVVCEETPTKFRPFTAEDYTTLIQGQALQWPYPEPDESDEPKKQEGNQSAPLDSEDRDLLKPRRPDRWSGDDAFHTRGNRPQSLLPPRFYSPSNRSVRLFQEGEGLSTNTDADRMIFTLPLESRTPHLRGESSNGTIEMMFQGDPNDIDPNSSTADLIRSAAQGSPLPRRDEHSSVTGAMQELRCSDRQHAPRSAQAKAGHLQPGISSSMLAGMMNGSSPCATGTPGTFQSHFPNAVPSPLNHNQGAHVPIPPMMGSPPAVGPTAMGLWSSPPPSKSIDDHFYMTNEHLDVVGKTTYDILATFSKDIMTTMKSKHDHISGTIEKRVGEVKSQIELVSDKADESTNRDYEMSAKLDGLLECIKNEVGGALSEQGKKTAELEMTIKELQKTVQILQQSVEGLHKAGYSHAHSTPTMTPPSGPSLGGYYGNGHGLSRDGPPSMAPAAPPMQDPHNGTNGQEGYHDTRGGYGSSYGQQRGPRDGYGSRSSKDERSPFSGTNPYHFSNGGQYNNNGYMGGYSYHVSAGEQQLGFGQKPMQ